MLEIPLQPIPNQTLTVQLANQACQLNVYQKFFGLFMDVSVNNNLIIAGVICQNLNKIVRDSYLGFLGDFAFVDTQGGTTPSDPQSSGLGARYRLVYIETTDT